MFFRRTRALYGVQRAFYPLIFSHNTRSDFYARGELKRRFRLREEQVTSPFAEQQLARARSIGREFNFFFS